MKRMPKVKDVMATFPFSISATASMAEAKGMMKQHNVGHLPVKLEDGILSVISLRELERIKLPGHSHTDFDELSVADMCPDQVYTVDLQTSLIEVLDHMSANHIDCALVTRQNKLAGVFTFTDACRAYSQQLKDMYFHNSGGDDAA
jgi:acetoin utilization protein AcuB